MKTTAPCSSAGRPAGRPAGRLALPQLSARGPRAGATGQLEAVARRRTSASAPAPVVSARMSSVVSARMSSMALWCPPVGIKVPSTAPPLRRLCLPGT